MIRGTTPGMKTGTVLGHEGVGIVEEVGKQVRNMREGDRVVIASTIACGNCSYCRAGYFSQCDRSNPNGPSAGTAFFGGTKDSGPFDGMQAERVRVPFANVGLVKLPPEVTDDDAILLSDILPTATFAVELAEVKNGDTVCVFGCGPVGQLAIMMALYKGAARVLAVDKVGDRLELAAEQGAEIIDFGREDPVAVVRELTGGIGVDRAIDAVGVDAEREPSQALRWATEAVCKAGTLGVVGVYPPSADQFPIGLAMNKNLAINMGNCHHRRYIPKLARWVASGALRPSRILTQHVALEDALAAYRAFGAHKPGWTKVELRPD